MKILNKDEIANETWPEEVFLVTGVMWRVSSFLQRIGFHVSRPGAFGRDGSVQTAATLDKELWHFLCRQCLSRATTILNDLETTSPRVLEERDVKHPAYPLWTDEVAENEDGLQQLNGCLFTTDRSLSYRKLWEYGLFEATDNAAWRLVMRTYASEDDIEDILYHWGFSRDVRTGDWVSSEENKDLYWFLSRRSAKMPLEQEEQFILEKYGERWLKLPARLQTSFIYMNYAVQEVRAYK